MAYSYSQLNIYLDCPKQYQFKYVDRISVPRRVSADMLLGNAVHKTVEQLYRHGSDAVVIALEDALKIYRDEWAKVDPRTIHVGSEYEGVDDYIASGERMIERFHGRYQPFDQGTLLGVEKQLFFDAPRSSFKFQAKIDRLWKRDDGIIEICDYKTGRQLIPATDTRFQTQMGLYQLAVVYNFPDFEDIEVAQYSLRHDEIIRTRIPEERLDELAEHLRASVAEIEHAKRLVDFTAREGSHCRFCDYESICPAKKHKQVLEQQPDLPVGDSPESAARIRELVDDFLEKHRCATVATADKEEAAELLRAIARETDMTRLEGARGHVTVKLGTKEKLVNKTRSARHFADLVATVKELGLEEYLTVDANALMRDGIVKRRLPDEVLSRLAPFVIEEQEKTVRASFRKTDESDDD